MKKIILFDLDGTIIDSSQGMTNSIMYALASLGIEVSDPKSLYPFIGPPLKVSFKKYFDLDDEQCKQAIAKYREYFRDQGYLQNIVYDGLPELFEKLRAAGRELYVATSKPTLDARRILEHHDLAGCFNDIQGSNEDGTRLFKGEVIEYVLAHNKLTDLSQIVMIGDREHDMTGAADCGVDTIGVLYGFGSRAELEAHGAGAIAATVAELDELLLRI